MPAERPPSRPASAFLPANTYREEMLAWHALLVALLVGTQALLTWVAVLNVRHGERAVRERASRLREAGVSDPERTVEYLRLRTGVDQLASWVTLGGVVLVLYSGLYRRAITAVADLGWGTVGEGVVLAVGAVLALQAASVPFDLYRTVVVEDLYESDERTVGRWLRRRAVRTGFVVALAAAVAAGVLWTVTAVGAWWPVLALALLAVVRVALQVVLPQVVLPLQYDLDPVEDGPLRESVETVFEGAGVTCEGVYEVGLGARTATPTAFFVGLGPAKRVCLSETLVEDYDREAVEAVLAHELGHYRLRHVWKRLAASLLFQGAALGALAVLVQQPQVVALFGLPATPYAALLTAGLFLWPVLRLTAPLRNGVAIRQEYRADAFAARATDDPAAVVRALTTLADDTSRSPFPHPLYEAVHHDHPPVPKRIRAVREQFPDARPEGVVTTGTETDGEDDPDPDESGSTTA